MFHSIERYVVISNPLKYRTGSVDRDDSKIIIDGDKNDQIRRQHTNDVSLLPTFLSLFIIEINAA